MSLNPSRITIKSLEVSYLENEAFSSRATIIFIHGFPFGKEIWKSQLEALPNDIHGITYDIRGYGESHAGHGFFSIDLFASDLIGFVQALGLNRVVLCGISMGGYIALRTFEQAPELVGGLILCDTNASADSNEAKLNRFKSIEKINTEGKGAFANEFIKKIFSQKTLNEKHDVVNGIYKLIMGLPESTLCATQLALASRTDTSASLSQVTVPALIIRGAEDAIMTKEQGLFLKEHIQNSEYVEVADSGHMPNLENPEAFNEVMKEFLKKV